MTDELKHPEWLPDEHVPNTNVRSIFSLLAGMAVVVLVANVMAYAALQWRNPNPGDVQIARKWEILRHDMKPGESIIVGDSSGNQGLDPQILMETLGGNWRNLCTLANSMTFDGAWMLNEYIEQHGPPKAVVMVHVFDGWDRQIHASALADTPYAIGQWQNLNPPIKASAKQTVEVALRRYFPLYFSEKSLKKMITRPWDIRDLRDQVRDDGFMPMKGNDPQQLRADFQSQRRQLEEGEPFRMSPINIDALNVIAKLAEEHGFDVFIVYGPCYDQLAALPTFDPHFDQVHAKLVAITREHPRIKLVLDRPMTFEDKVLQNCEHVTVAGAEPYSRAVAARLNQLGAGEESDSDKDGQ